MNGAPIPRLPNRRPCVAPAERRESRGPASYAPTRWTPAPRFRGDKFRGGDGGTDGRVLRSKRVPLRIPRITIGRKTLYSGPGLGGNPPCPMAIRLPKV